MFKYLLKAPQRKVDSVLNKQLFLHQADRLAVRNQIKADKSANRVSRIKATSHAKLWSDLIRHLKYERANALVSLKYYRQRVSIPHIEAFEAYIHVLTRLLQKMEEQKKAGQFTPSQIAREKKLANHGVHWTDWIGKQKQLVIGEMFAALPYQAKAKRKVPFLRTARPDPKEVGNRAKQRLYERTTNEYRTELIKQRLLPNDERAARLSNMLAALDKISQLKPTDFVPHTWHGLYPEQSKDVDSEGAAAGKTVHGEPKSRAVPKE